MELGPHGGTYVVLCRNGESGSVGVGRLGSLCLRRGWYAYVGSAFGPGGLRARVSRHLRGSASRRWHIDSLRPVVTPRAVWFAPGPARLEHRWAQALELAASSQIPLRGFGSSDCRCRSHLFFFPRRPRVDLLGSTVHELSAKRAFAVQP